MTLILTSKPLSNSPSLYLQFLVRLFHPPTLSELVWKKRFCRLDLCHKTFGFCFQTRMIFGDWKHPELMTDSWWRYWVCFTQIMRPRLTRLEIVSGGRWPGLWSTPTPLRTWGAGKHLSTGPGLTVNSDKTPASWPPPSNFTRDSLKNMEMKSMIFRLNVIICS